MRRLAVSALVLAGCSTGTGTLPVDASLDHSTWLELDLADGQVRSVAEPDARTLAQARWRSSHMLFRRIDAASVQVDAVLPGDGEAEDRAAVAGRMAYLAVFELTQAQWRRLWDAQVPDGLLPATGMSPEDLRIAIGARSTSRFRLDLPDAGLWSVACAAGSSDLFAWGNGTATEAAGTYAVLQPVEGSGPRGPATVGSLTANALGLHDMHGNVWEIVSQDDGYAVRGGAWDSPALQCRTMNTVVISADLSHPSIGARLVLRP